MTKTRGIIAAMTALAVSGGVALTTTASASPAPHQKVRRFTKTVALEAALLSSTQRLCKYEDGFGSQLPCRWDAKKQGNGRGDTYVVVFAGKTKKGATKVIYVYADHDERGTLS